MSARVVKVKTIGDFVEELAPLRLAEDWDNVGLLAGRADKEVDRILIALDATAEVINEAISKKCQMLVTHHPLIFKGLKSVTDLDNPGKKLLMLIENNIALYSAHTNLDKARGGVNDCLCDIFQLENIEAPRDKNGEEGLIRVGSLKNPLPLGELAKKYQELLKLNYLPIAGKPDKIISRVAVCGGSGMSLLSEAIESGADLYVTGDVKYHDACHALECGLSILDASHYGSEIIVLKPLRDFLLKKRDEQGMSFEVFISEINAQPFDIVR